MRIHVLTAASTKMTVFWNVARCSLVEVYQSFRCAYAFHHRGDERLISLIMEVVSTSETSVKSTTLHERNITEDSYLREMFLIAL
jgi:hypothetical protein